MKIKVGDIVVILSLVVISCSVIFLSFAYSKQSGRSALVNVNGKPTATLKLETPTRLEVTGPVGITVVEVDEKGAFISESPCPHHYCIRMGHARIKGQTIVCVPNGVSLRIIGGDGEGVDGVVG